MNKQPTMYSQKKFVHQIYARIKYFLDLQQSGSDKQNYIHKHQQLRLIGKEETANINIRKQH